MSIVFPSAMGLFRSYEDEQDVEFSKCTISPVGKLKFLNGSTLTGDGHGVAACVEVVKLDPGISTK